MSELATAEGVIGIVHSILKNGDGEVFDSSAGRQSMPYLHGANNIVSGRESAMVGKVAGGKPEVVGAWAWLTANHSRADIELHFDVEVIGVRSALPVDLDHGHPHGLDTTLGHHH